jgi:hypothetical protein
VVSGSAGLKSTADSSGVLALQTNGATAVTVTAAGSVGIGTTTPADGLNISTGKKFRATHSASVYQQIFSSASGNFLNAYGDNFQVNADSGAIYLTTVAAQPIVFQTTNTDRLVILSGGNVGIGTSSPGNKLAVNGGSTQTVASFASTSTAVFYSLANSGSQTFIGNDSTSGSFVVQTPGSSYSTKFIITDAGKVGIGTTAPDLTLDVYGSAGVNGEANRIMVLQTNNTATAGYGGGLAFGGYYDGTTSRVNDFAGIQGFKENGTAGNYAGALRFTTRVNGGSPTERMRITSAGDVGIGTPNPSAKLEVFTARTSSTNAISIILSDSVTGAQTNGVYKSIQSISNNGASKSEIRFVETDGTNNNTAIAFATANTAGGLTERMRVLNTGSVLCLAGGNTAATGTGIAFPSSINTSSDPNTLDDYEEGTWTPSYGSGATSVTYGSVRDGHYRKIGSQVTIWFGIMTNSLTASASGLTITGLPFTASSGAGSNGTVNINLATRWVSGPPIVGSVSPSTTTIILYNSIAATGAGTDAVEVTTANMSTSGSNNRNIVFATATYFV